MSSGEGKVVGVTGVSGFIASWLVKLLLEHGYTVRASVLDLNDPKETQHLMSLYGAKRRLHLVAANLLEDGSFDSIIDGCVGVFHTASPVLMSVDNPQAELLDPALKGTLNVLQSCTRFASVKRVVMTSSIFAVVFNRELKTGAVVDESWFSDPSYCEDHKMWDALSKTMAENAAWEFAKVHNMDMVAINPGMVVGPLLQPSINPSVELILDLVNGSEAFPNATHQWVDVRDVAYAHILAFEIPSASGRYCMVERSAHASEIVKMLRELYPTHKFPDKVSEDGGMLLINPDYAVSTNKAKSLGIEFIPLKLSLKDAIESLKKKKFVSM